MVFLFEQECRCCQKSARTRDRWHCKDCWNKYHNGLRDNDWESEEIFRKHNPNNGFFPTIEEINKKIGVG